MDAASPGAKVSSIGFDSAGRRRPSHGGSEYLGRRTRKHPDTTPHSPVGRNRRPADEPSPLGAYLRDVGSHRVLTRREEVGIGEAIERHTDALHETLLGIPFTGRLLVERWSELRRAKRATANLSARSPAQRDPKAGARIDRAMSRVKALLSRRARLSGRRDEGSRECTRIDTEIQRLLLEIDLSPKILGEALHALREHHAALSPGGAHSKKRRARADLVREIGLPVSVFHDRMRDIEAHARALMEARNRFVEHNLKLVIKIAREFSGMGLPLIDLIQEGNLILLHAVEKFDHRRGVRFSTYGSWWIRQACIRAIQQQARTIRLPSNVYDRMLRMERLDGQLASRLGRAPEPRELGEALRVSDRQLETLRRVRRNTISLEAPFPGPDDKAVEDTVADATLPSPVNSLYRHQVARAIPDLLPNLSGRERRVLRWRFGLDSERPHTLAEIGLKLELSRERVRQIEISSIEKLRHQLEERRLLETTDRETSP